MSYPGRPVASSIPCFLNPFDPLFQANAISAVTGEIAGIASPAGTGFGGAVVTEGPWQATNTPASPNPRTALFAWSFVRIVPAGFSGTSPMLPVPQIRGPAFGYFTTDQGGVGFLT